MALFSTRSAAVHGIHAHLIDVEVDMYPSANLDFITVGMPDEILQHPLSKCGHEEHSLRNDDTIHECW